MFQNLIARNIHKTHKKSNQILNFQKFNSQKYSLGIYKNHNQKYQIFKNLIARNIHKNHNPIKYQIFKNLITRNSLGIHKNHNQNTKFSKI